MATGGGGESGRLTRKQIVRLAAAISADNMESIAEGYLDIEPETVKNIWRENLGKAEAFNRDIIRRWANKNSGPSQTRKLAELMYDAAADCGYVDPTKVQQILGVSQSQAKSTTLYIEVTQEEFLTLAEDLRPHTAQAMKIEVAPWIREYVTDMDDLYSELTLEKLYNKPRGQERVKLDNYKELFPLENSGHDTDEPPPSKIPRGVFRKKILFKGDPGIGKTTLSKKIAFDWAKGYFTSVSIVFFVLLKLVKPGEAIENVIIQQTPTLEGLHVTREKVASILESYGDQCLLILDGLDEHDLGKNEDVLKIVKGAKYLRCNVVLTSRPHSSKEIEKYFETIVSIEGFTRNEAKKFASRIVSDEEKVEQILDFRPWKKLTSFEKLTLFDGLGELSTGKISLHRVPILLSFMCLLVREEDFDLSSTTNTGEIYLRMVRCLYKKFTIRKGIDFEMSSFVEMLKSLGKVALETLLSDSLVRRSEIIKVVGEDAFDCGLLIGHEDAHWLIRDETADISVTFGHRSLQEFLGSLFFILTIDQQESLQNLDKFAHEFLNNPTFCQFCVWFLENSEKLSPMRNARKVYELLVGYGREQINDVRVNLYDIGNRFHALWMSPDEATNRSAVEMLCDILVGCSEMKHLLMHTYHPVEQILSSVRPVFNSLHSIQISGSFFVEDFRLEDTLVDSRLTKRVASSVDRLRREHINTENEFNVVLRSHWSQRFVSFLSSVFKMCTEAGRFPCLYFDLKQTEKGTMCELVDFLHETIKQLHLFDHGHLLCHRELPFCPNLTHLCLRDSRSDVKEGLSTAIRNSKFPSLTHLSLANCSKETEGSLRSLLGSNCSKIKHLDLCNSRIIAEDVHFLASTNGDDSVLPNISSLVLSSSSFVGGVEAVSTLLQYAWPNLTSLTLEDLLADMYTVCVNSLNKSKLPNLTELFLIVREDEQVNVELPNPEKLPRLEYLTLNRAIQSTEQVNPLGEEITKWKLKKLDLSETACLGKGNLSTLLSHSFPSLQSLILVRCRLSLEGETPDQPDGLDLRHLVRAKRDGRLPELKHLDVSYNGLYGWPECDRVCQSVKCIRDKSPQEYLLEFVESL